MQEDVNGEVGVGGVRFSFVLVFVLISCDFELVKIVFVNCF